MKRIVSRLTCLTLFILLFFTTSRSAISPTITSLEDLGATIQASFDQLESTIKLTVPTASKDTYCTIITDLSGIDYYTLSYTTTKDSTSLVIKPTYKQAFRITQFLSYPYLEPKLTADDKKLLQLAQSIVNEVTTPGMTPYEKELALHDYVVNTTAYAYNELTNSTLKSSAYTAAGVLIDRLAVCEGYSEAMKILLNLVDIPCEIVYGITEVNVNHSWNIVMLDNEWYMLDATYNDPIVFDNGVRQHLINYDYFNITSEVLSLDHTWDVTKWPIATSVKYNYYTQNGNLITNYADFKSYIIHAIQSGKKEIDCYLTQYNSSYNLNFIFNYYSGTVKYYTPSTSKGTFKLLLQ